jgi:hypothetical protein
MVVWRKMLQICAVLVHGIIEDGAALDTTHLTGFLAVFRQDLIEQTTMYADEEQRRV